MTGAPLISIITPTFNRTSIKKAIASSMYASRVQIEHIIVDDCSKKDYWDMLVDISKKFPDQLRVFRNAKNCGPGASRNFGLQQSSAKFIFFLDSDDFLAPEALESMVDEAEKSGSDIVIPMALRQDQKIHGNFLSIDACSGVPFSHCAAIKDLGPCKLFNRNFLIKNNLQFPSQRYWGEDQLFMLKAYLATSRISILTQNISLFLTEAGDNLTTKPKLEEVLDTIYEILVFSSHLDITDVRRILILRRIFNSDLRAITKFLENENKRWPHIDKYIHEKIMPFLDPVTSQFIDEDLKLLLYKHFT